MTLRRSSPGRATVCAGAAVRGLTLVELLVVVAILALLAALLLPSLRTARAKAKSVQCISHLRQLGVALTLYLGDNREVFPYYKDPGVPEPHGFWYKKLTNGQYLPGYDLFLCAGSTHQITYPDPKWYAWYWGGISYGISLALSFDYNLADYPDYLFKAASLPGIAKHSETILVVDAYPANGTIFYGRYHVYAYSVIGAAPYVDSMAWPRHNGACNVLWVDGHVSTVLAPDPADAGSLYTPGALTTLWADPSYWDRK